MERKMIFLAMVGTALALTGCATTTALSKDVWKDPTTKIGIAVAQLPKAAALKAGSQGMLDVVINEAAAGSLEKSMENTDMSAFLTVREKMAAKITDGGLQPVVIEDLVDLKSFPKKKNEKTGASFIDYSALKAQYGIDYIIVLEVPSVGTWRNYYGFIPVGDPKAICLGHGVMVKIDDGAKQWEYSTNYKKSLVNVEGKWHEPPEYPNVKAALQKAIVAAADDLVKNFK